MLFIERISLKKVVTKGLEIEAEQSQTRVVDGNNLVNQAKSPISLSVISAASCTSDRLRVLPYFLAPKKIPSLPVHYGVNLCLILLKLAGVILPPSSL